MKYRIIIFLNLIISLNAIISAQEIDGNWSSSQLSEEGKIEVIYQLITNGNDLTGKVITGENEYKIINGLVNGSTISFMIKYGDVTVYHTGYLLRGQLLINTRYQGNTAQFTLNKAVEDSVLKK